MPRRHVDRHDLRAAVIDIFDQFTETSGERFAESGPEKAVHHEIERVAEGVTAEVISRLCANMRIAVFAGPGNNGADALAVARMLAEQGYRPEVFLFNNLHYKITQNYSIPTHRLS